MKKVNLTLSEEQLKRDNWKKRFDEEFVFGGGQEDCFLGNSYDDTVIPSEIKTFIEEELTKMAKEMIGEEKSLRKIFSFFQSGNIDYENYSIGWNDNRLHCIDIARKYKLNI